MDPLSFHLNKEFQCTIYVIILLAIKHDDMIILLKYKYLNPHLKSGVLCSSIDFNMISEQPSFNSHRTRI